MPVASPSSTPVKPLVNHTRAAHVPGVGVHAIDRAVELVETSILAGRKGSVCVAGMRCSLSAAVVLGLGG